MKEYHRNYVNRPNETEKKGRRVKNQPNDKLCKCFAPFVKLHYHDCPLMKKPCPVHGNPHYHGMKEAKGEFEQNMIISFHPSSKTERLFQPVKTLLANCNPETKINLQYYSPKSITSNETIKHHQLKADDGSRSLNNNIFVEKTKSFVADKTNKIKKLKQCFYSPCNSIAQKSQSQTSIKEKFHDIFRSDRGKTKDFINLVPENPPDDIKFDSNLPWFSNKFGFENWEKFSAEKNESDFITVTQHAKNNLINHKIFEIKHKKGLNDVPFVKLPQQSSQLIYSSLNVERRANENSDYLEDKEKRRLSREGIPLQKKDDSQETDEKHERNEDLSGSENSQTSSCSSVYLTPFIFMPAATDSDSDSKLRNSEKSDKTVQVGEPSEEKIKGRNFTQEKQTPNLQSEELISVVDEPKTKSVFMQTDSNKPSVESAIPGWYLRQPDVADSFTTRGTQTEEPCTPSPIWSRTSVSDNANDSKRISNFPSNNFPSASENKSDDNYACNKQTSVLSSDFEVFKTPKPKKVKTAAVQTSDYRQKRTILNTFSWDKNMADKTCQTESFMQFRTSSKNVIGPKTVFQKVANKSTQTFSGSESVEKDSELTSTNSSNVTYVIKPFKENESDQAIDKMAKVWWGKSRSDSELYGSKSCSCSKPEYIIPLPQGCSCKSPEMSQEAKTPKRKSVVRDLYINDKGPFDSSNFPEMEDKALEAGCVTNRTRGTDSRSDRFSVARGKINKGLGTDKIDNRVETAQGTNSKEDKILVASKAEQTSLKGEESQTPLSDLSELTRIIQEFFEKTGKSSWKNCTCEAPTAPEKKIDTPTTEFKTPKKELVEDAVGTQTITERKVNRETMTDIPKKSKGEVAAHETQVKREPVTEELRGHLYSDRVNFRRSLLLDENKTNTIFICSLCAREINIFQTFPKNANTENLLSSPRKKEKTTSNGTEVSKMVQLRTVRTVSNTPKRLTSAPEDTERPQIRNVNSGISTTPSKPFPRTPQKSSISTSRTGADLSYSERATRETQSSMPPYSAKPAVKTTSNKYSEIEKCLCNETAKVCTIESCRRRGNANFPTTSKATPPQKTDLIPSLPRTDHPGVSNTHSRTNRNLSEKNPTQRRSPEHSYPVFVKSIWSKEFTWNINGESQNNVLDNSKSETFKQKRNYEKEMEPADTPAGKKIKNELEEPLTKCFVFGDPDPKDSTIWNRTPLSNKTGFFSVPFVSPLKENSSNQPDAEKSERKVKDANYLHKLASPEDVCAKDSPDLFPAKSCHLTPISLEFKDKSSFDKLFECRVCKSVKFMKTDKENVLFHLPYWFFTYRPDTQEVEESATPHVSEEEVQRTESSKQTLKQFLEECSLLLDRSDSPSTEDVLEEDSWKGTEEEPDMDRSR